MDKDDAVERVMRDFDTSSDNHVDLGEFVSGISKWLIEAKGSLGFSAESGSLISNYHRVSLARECFLFSIQLSLLTTWFFKYSEQSKSTIFWGQVKMKRPEKLLQI